jgi:hypothetical protein
LSEIQRNKNSKKAKGKKSFEMKEKKFKSEEKLN